MTGLGRINYVVVGMTHAVCVCAQEGETAVEFASARQRQTASEFRLFFIMRGVVSG